MTTQTIGLILYLMAIIATVTSLLVWLARLIRARMERRKPAPWNDEL